MSALAAILCAWSYSLLCVSDNNECLDNNGQCQSVCINTPGSFSCSCESGFLLLTDGRSCVGESCVCVFKYVYSNEHLCIYV